MPRYSFSSIFPLLIPIVSTFTFPSLPYGPRLPVGHPCFDTLSCVALHRVIHRNKASTSVASSEREKEPPAQLPDDPYELERMERQFYEKEKKAEEERLLRLRRDLDSIPRLKQCHRYRWHQSETMFDVEVPMPKPCEDKDLYLVVRKDQLQIAIKTDDSFGTVLGTFVGDIDEENSTFRQHYRNGEPYIHLQLVKLTSEGVYEFWPDLLVGEEESPTIRFAGESDRYRWKQNAETIEVEIPVPDNVTKRRTNLDLHPSGKRMKLSFDIKPEFEVLEGDFKGLINPLDSVWMLDEDKNGKILALTIKKRREEKDKTSWWSGVLVGDDQW